MDFQCSKCGACCRLAGELGLMPQREDGACINLAEDNTCKIYETRPLVCRAGEMAEINRKPLGMTKLAYFKMSSTLCNRLIKDYGMDDKYLIDIEAYGTDT
jgi:Fe-S-cluster containining protein